MNCTSTIEPNKKYEPLQNQATLSNCPTATVYKNFATIFEAVIKAGIDFALGKKWIERTRCSAPILSRQKEVFAGLGAGAAALLQPEAGLEMFESVQAKAIHACLLG